MIYQLTAPDAPQGQRYGFAVVKRAAYYVCGAKLDYDAFNVLESCAALVKWGRVELETFSWDGEE